MGFAEVVVANTRLIAIVVAYMVISLGIVFFNKQIFSRTLKFPIFVSWFQQFFGFFIVSGMTWTSKLPKMKWLGYFPDFVPRWNVLKACLPAGVFFVFSIALSNTCLQVVSVATYHIARSTTIFFNIVFVYILLGERTSLPAIGTVILVVAGFLIGGSNSSTVSVFGLLLGGGASLCQSLSNVLAKRALSLINNDQNVLVQYNMLISSVLFIPCIYLGGEGDWVDAVFAPSTLLTIAAALVASAFLAILINVSTYMVIRETGPVTFNMVGMFKSCVQTVGGVVFLGDYMSTEGWVAAVLTIVGSSLYSYVKYCEGEAAKAAAGSSSKVAYTELKPEVIGTPVHIEKV